MPRALGCGVSIASLRVFKGNCYHYIPFTSCASKGHISFYFSCYLPVQLSFHDACLVMITKLSLFNTSQTWRVNLKALELVKQVEWPFYVESSIAYDSTFSDQMKVKMPRIQSMNFR